jgi:hypothetical protein
MRLSWQKSQKSDPVKALPRSVTILLGTPEPMGDVFYELRGLFRCDRCDGADLNPLGKFIHRH